MTVNTFPDASGPVAAGRSASKYDAFLSYCHRDGAAAAGIQKGLHRIGRSVGQLSALRVFRDSTDLAANPNLWGKVAEALDTSRYLIVVLSPQAAASQWVNKEVAHWLSQRGPDQLLLALSEGRLHWDETNGRLDPQTSDAAVLALTEPGSLPNEPLFVDISGESPWDPNTPSFRDKVTDLAAPIHGKSKYDLASDDVRELRRFRRLRRRAIAALVFLTILSLIAAGWAFRSQRLADTRMKAAVAQQLTTEGRATLTGARGGDDLRAIQGILAAPKISDSADLGALFTGVVSRSSTLKIIPLASQVFSVAFSPDGQRFASGNFDSRIRLWRADTAELIGEPLSIIKEIPGGVLSMAFSPDGHRLAAGYSGNTVRLWNVDTGQPIGKPLTGHTDSVNSVAFSPDGHRIASGSVDKTIRLWKADTGQPIGEPLTGHTDSVNSVAFSPDGHRIASGSDDKTIRLWNADTGQPIGEAITGHEWSVYSVAFNPDGNRIASASMDDTVRIWDADTGQPIGKPLTGHTDSVNSVAFSPDGHRIASGSDDKTIRLWNADTGQPIADPLKGPNRPVRGVVFSPDGSRLLTANEDATVRLWDADPAVITAPKAVWSAAVSPDGRLIASGASGGMLQLWDTDSGQPVGKPLTGHTEVVNSVAFSPDGHRIASGSDDMTIRLWNTETGQQIGEPLTGHTGAVNSVAFSPDGHRLASGSSDNTVRLWNTETGRQIRQMEKTTSGSVYTGPIYSVAFSPDGHRLASNALYGVRVWDADTGEAISDPLEWIGRMAEEFIDPSQADTNTAGRIPHTGFVFSVAYSPDGLRLASASDDGTVHLWNAETVEPIGQPLIGHSEPVRTVAFSPDGRHLASGGDDKTIRLWRADNGQSVGEPLIGHTRWVTSIAFGPQDQRLVSASLDHTVRIWPTTNSAAWADLLCSKLTAVMSRKQWDEWIPAGVPYREICPSVPATPD